MRVSCFPSCFMSPPSHFLCVHFHSKITLLYQAYKKIVSRNHRNIEFVRQKKYIKISKLMEWCRRSFVKIEFPFFSCLVPPFASKKNIIMNKPHIFFVLQVLVLAQAKTVWIWYEYRRDMSQAAVMIKFISPLPYIYYCACFYNTMYYKKTYWFLFDHIKKKIFVHRSALKCYEMEQCWSISHFLFWFWLEIDVEVIGPEILFSFMLFFC